MRLVNRVALVTGGAAGLGAAIVERFIKEGATVYIADIDDEKGRALSQTLGEQAHYTHLDVTSEDDWASAVTAIERLDVLVNNAGVSTRGSIEDVTLEKFRADYDIDVFGVMLGCRHGISKMKSQRSGSIINLTSATVEINEPEMAIYTSAKAAVVSLTKSTALHCIQNKNGIRVNAIAPGIFKTEMFDSILSQVPEGQREAAVKRFESKVPFGRFGKVEELASAAVYLASDEESGFTTGLNMLVDGGTSL